MQIDESIFKAYDVRGIAGEGLNEETMKLIGQAFGSYVRQRGGQIVVLGMDIRRSSNEYYEAVKAGLMASGCVVRTMGVVATPTMYYAAHQDGVDGGVMITASHNPANYNGVKFSYENRSLPTAEIEILKEMILKGDLLATNSGREEEYGDITDRHLQEIAEKIKLAKPLKVAMDPSGSVAALVVPKLMKMLGCQIEIINGEIDPNFSLHQPDPITMDNYGWLKKLITESGADMGVMYDGDADRVGFVDNHGEVWMGDKIEMLLARDILAKKPGEKVIVELKNSEAVVEEVKRLGGVPIFGQTGHTLIEEKLHAEGAILAAEMSCHYYIADGWYKFDDAIYALARVMSIVADSGQSLAELMADIPNYPATPEYRVAVPADRQKEIVQEVVDYCREKCDHYIDIDGIRGYIGDGWFLVRSSNTQPVISVRAEGKTEADLATIKDFIQNKLNSIDGVNLDWNRQVDEA
ncbi:MAG TPA: phosphomannomutase/phosphoglucomutase [bacterium]|nr:phosphomannomutase/phosphoglucomutase [bacterium]